ncbi:hypothetical protein UYSO10_0033 [Kosakonia radicincitans]|nr:hypothetical protein UYSO10_0033 [Kosakonia radicincitans]
MTFHIKMIYQAVNVLNPKTKIHLQPYAVNADKKAKLKQ